MKRLLVQLDDGVHERLKRIAFTHRRSMAALVREMVRVGLGKPIPGPGRRRNDMGSVARDRSKRRRGR